jgi:excisionase family DNA binding protein
VNQQLLNRTSADNQSLKLLSEPEASSALGISKITLQRKRKDGAISFYRVGGRVLYAPCHLEEYLSKCEQKARG